MDLNPDSKPSLRSPELPANRAERFLSIRQVTSALAAPLSAEDCAIQSMPDASPVKWHLAHTTWFFETFVLAPHQPGYRPLEPSYRVLFNSYYHAVGDRHPRPERGLLSRPGLEQVLAYRAHVDVAMLQLLAGERSLPEVDALIDLGLHHEQQHQELILTDVKHLLSRNPLKPARSDYGPYPGFRCAPGAVGEYNGKFMSGQYVLRGGSCATPSSHIRASYRNFFPPDARWQFSGLRLARDAE